MWASHFQYSLSLFFKKINVIFGQDVNGQFSDAFPKKNEAFLKNLILDVPRFLLTDPNKKKYLFVTRIQFHNLLYSIDIIIT